MGGVDLAAVLSARSKMKKVGDIARNQPAPAPKPEAVSFTLKKVTPQAPKAQEPVHQVSFLGNLKSTKK